MVKAQAVSIEIEPVIKLTVEIQQIKMELAEILDQVKTSPRGNMPHRFGSDVY